MVVRGRHWLAPSSKASDRKRKKFSAGSRRQDLKRDEGSRGKDRAAAGGKETEQDRRSSACALRHKLLDHQPARIRNPIFRCLLGYSLRRGSTTPRERFWIDPLRRCIHPNANPSDSDRSPFDPLKD